MLDAVDGVGSADSGQRDSRGRFTDCLLPGRGNSLKRLENKLILWYSLFFISVNYLPANCRSCDRPNARPAQKKTAAHCRVYG